MANSDFPNNERAPEAEILLADPVDAANAVEALFRCLDARCRAILSDGRGKRTNMLLKTTLDDLPTDIASALHETDLIIRSYLAAVSFIVQDTARDPEYLNNHLLSYLAQDVLQSSVSILTLAMEGMQSVAKRELRFLIETSIKICFVQQQSYSSAIGEKLSAFEKELSSQRISIKQNINLSMLPDGMGESFTEEVGRLYGLTSSYVHLTPSQIQERIAAVDAGKTAGKESAEDIAELNKLTSRGLAASLVLLFHSVPEYVAGDWLVEENGGMDSNFDYKHERQADLTVIRSTRQARVKF